MVASLMPLVTTQTRLLLISGSVSLATLMSMGYTNAYPNTAFLSFKSFFNESMSNRGTPLEQTVFTWIWSAYLNIWFLGFLLGTLLAPKITDRFGRKQGLLLANLMCITATITSLLSILLMCPELLIIGRSMVAFASAIGMCSLILFLQEVSPTAIRGQISSYPELCMCLAHVLGIVCGLKNILGGHLMFLIGLPIIPNLLAILFLIRCPETPKFLLINKKNLDMALQSIIYFQGTDSNREKVLEAIEAENQEATCGTLTSLPIIWKTRHLRRAQLIGIVALLLQISTGVNAVLFLSIELFVRAGLSQLAAELGTVGMVALMSISTIFSMRLVDRCGRRQLLLGFGMVNIACLSAFTAFAFLQKTQHWASYGCMIAVLAFSITFSLGPGPIPWYIASEMVPQRHRSSVQSVALTIRSIVACAVGMVTLPLYDSLGSYSFIPLFIIPSIICVIYLYKEMPETKGEEVHATVAKLSTIKVRPPLAISTIVK